MSKNMIFYAYELHSEYLNMTNMPDPDFSRNPKRCAIARENKPKITKQLVSQISL
jgi:hypothetical protein